MRQFFLIFLMIVPLGAVAKNWVEPALGEWGRCVFVANDHGQVLRQWLEVTAGEKNFHGPFTVLHIDAHNDLNVPELTRIDDTGLAWLNDVHVRESLAQSADLANYQQVAAWAGLVDRVIWVRQGWGSIEKHDLTLEFDHQSGSFIEKVGVTDAYHDGPRVNLHFHEFPEENLLDDQSCCEAKEDVFSLLRDGKYILDIDLDYFVPDWATPDRPPWLTSGTSCPAACTRWPELDCPLWHHLMNCMASDCGFDQQGCADAVLRRWHHLSSRDRKILDEFHMPEAILVLDQIVRRKSAPPIDVKLHKGRLGRLQYLFEQIGYKKPIFVTIARSVDAFTNIFHAYGLENELFKLLSESWPDANGTSFKHCATYAEGTSSLETLGKLSHLVQTRSFKLASF